jgi:hypothetical protein
VASYLLFRLQQNVGGWSSSKCRHQFSVRGRSLPFKNSGLQLLDRGKDKAASRHSLAELYLYNLNGETGGSCFTRNGSHHQILAANFSVHCIHFVFNCCLFSLHQSCSYHCSTTRFYKCGVIPFPKAQCLGRSECRRSTGPHQVPTVELRLELDRSIKSHQVCLTILK